MVLDNTEVLDLVWSCFVLVLDFVFIRKPLDLLSFALCLLDTIRVGVVLVCFALMIRSSTHIVQEVKNPKQLLGWCGRWGYRETLFAWS